METPIKMSQFSIASTLPSGSYFIAVIPSGSLYENKRVSTTDVLSLVNSTRWKTVPAHYDSPGVDGDEAKDDTYYYIHTNGIWRRVPFNPTLF